MPWWQRAQAASATRTGVGSAGVVWHSERRKCRCDYVEDQKNVFSSRDHFDRDIAIVEAEAAPPRVVTNVLRPSAQFCFAMQVQEKTVRPLVAIPGSASSGE